jgi:hypothetical protein
MLIPDGSSYDSILQRAASIRLSLLPLRMCIVPLEVKFLVCDLTFALSFIRCQLNQRLPYVAAPVIV